MALLEVNDLSVYYGVIQALKNISFVSTNDPPQNTAVSTNSV